MGCRVQGAGFGVQGLGCRVQGAGLGRPRTPRERERVVRPRVYLSNSPYVMCYKHVDICINMFTYAYIYIDIYSYIYI
jgi:hypothetical protein